MLLNDMYKKSTLQNKVRLIYWEVVI